MLRLLPLVLVSSFAAAASTKPVVAVLPVHASAPELARLGLLIDARSTALLGASGKVIVLDMKQVLAMAGQESLDPSTFAEPAVAERVRVLLGADRVVTLSLQTDADGLTLLGSLRDGKKPVEFSAKAPNTWSTALSITSDAVARAVLDADPVGAAQPQSASEPALKALATCWETALRQPMGLDAPVGLSSADLDGAVAACQVALKADPALRFAAATLGLLQAISRADADAEKTLGPSADSDPALMPWVLARFWLLTRNKSNEAAVTFLSSVIAKHPNELVLRSLRASALAAMNEHPRAEAAWGEYLALAPSSAFAQGRLSRSLARQGKTALALAAAKKGLELAPQSHEARLALAARQLDAGKLADAKASLQPLVDLPKPPAEPLLHLGLAYQAAGDLTQASTLFQSASDKATGPKAWRIKGHAQYQLALCAVKQGHLDAAKAAYARSVETGFVVTPADPALAEVSKSVGPAVKSAPTQAASGGLYLNITPFSDSVPLTPTATELVQKVLHEKLSTLGATFAPADEDKAHALAQLRAHGQHGYELQLRVTPGESAKALKVDLLVLSYPEQALKGDWSVKASGGKQESLIKAMVARALDDAAGDLDWKN